MSTLTKEDWIERIEPHLATSLQTASERITRTEAVQSWLHDATMEAAEGLGDASGMQGEMTGYLRMMDALERTLPELLAAVDEMTEGCGQIDLHWRPLQPNFSRLYIDFGRDYTVKLFTRLTDCTETAVQKTLATVAEALPQGRPFPNRPNTATGIVARKGTSIGVRVKEHLSEDQSTYRSVSLLPADGSPREGLSESDAVRALLEFLCSSAPTSYE